MGFASPGLACLDPERYGGLHHPGDRFSYDIFSLAGDAVRRGTRTAALDDEGSGRRDGQFATDEAGNVLGGVRTPHVDVPVAVLSGLGNSGGPVAFLAGTTTPLGTDALRGRYPTPAAYLEQFKEATARAVAAGFLLVGADADEITAIAAINSPAW